MHGDEQRWVDEAIRTNWVSTVGENIDEIERQCAEIIGRKFGVSPIIYKQQIGRALSVGDGRTPVIFDIVNNFDGLYTVSALSTELSALVNLYRRQNRENPIEVDSFEVIDELRDCREILQQIENALASTWDSMYQEAKKYYQEHGNLLVPKKYYTPDSNLPLGLWIITQRRVYRGMSNGTLTPERIDKLNQIGMVWEEKTERLWEEGFRHAETYYQAHGNLDVTATYVCEDGYRLGGWISNQRAKRKGHNGRTLTDEQIERLDHMGTSTFRRSMKMVQNYGIGSASIGIKPQQVQ